MHAEIRELNGDQDLLDMDALMKAHETDKRSADDIARSDKTRDEKR
jgi:hypothetical protein